MRPRLRRAFGLVSIIAVGVCGPLSVTAANAAPPKGSGDRPLIVFRSTADMFVPEGKDAIWDIWAVRPDGSGLRRLTHDKADDSFPDISPDGSTVIFDSSRQGGEIFSMNLATRRVKALTSSPGETASTTPVFSPDGTRIAFTSLSVPDLTWSLYVMDADGSNVARVTDVDAEDPYRATWSPDGTQLAFASFAADGNDNLHIFVVNADGSHRRQITKGSGEYEPAWSPDGTRIAYFEKGAVWVMSADGSDPRRVAQGGLSAFQPTWSPDGKQLAYVNESPGHTDLAVVGVDRRDQHRVTTALRHQADEAPSWGGAPTAKVARGGEVELAGYYNVELAPIPGACAGLTDCDTLQPLNFEMVITSPGVVGVQAISVAGHETPLTAQDDAFVAAGSLPEELITSTCDGTPAPTTFEMRFTVSVTQHVPDSVRAEEIGGTYNEDSPTFNACTASSTGYTLTGVRAPS